MFIQIARKCRWVKAKLFQVEIPRCTDCDGLVKPDITFFGEALPARFRELYHRDLKEADAVIVIGTSLNVNPFALLIKDKVLPFKTPRLLINREVVGEGGLFGFDFSGKWEDYLRDALFLGDCDDGCAKLAELLGFGEELDKLVQNEHDRIEKEWEIASKPDDAPLTSAVDASAAKKMLENAFQDLSIKQTDVHSFLAHAMSLGFNLHWAELVIATPPADAKDVPRDPPAETTESEDDSSKVLETTSIDAFVKYLKDKGCKKIVVMTGAGISTSAGIPDFRSPGTGLYDNLSKFDLPYPEAVFDIRYFRYRPEPFYALAKELYPGLFKPTKCHYFIRLLAEKDMLLRCYTQNIDTLERVAGIDGTLIVEAHGSFATARCVGQRQAPPEDSDDERPALSSFNACGKEYSQDWVKAKIFDGKIPTCTNCEGLVKPDITFFGEGLPTRFWTLHPPDLREADALIVIGTSLKVHPFASLVGRLPAKTPRLLINREVVGEGGRFGFDFSGETAEYQRDALFLGDCDDGCAKLAELLGFGGELDKLVQDEHDRIKKEWENPSKPDGAPPASPVGVSAIDKMLENAFQDLYIK
ncbi:NAD-dependent protein deacetylase sirtuin-2 [Phlyctochytrium planicorne]|nr:NAD-dependent protein deacetylase sirtuin-2 [Phlyctochytrium planicorne]